MRWADHSEFPKVVDWRWVGFCLDLNAQNQRVIGKSVFPQLVEINCCSKWLGKISGNIIFRGKFYELIVSRSIHSKGWQWCESRDAGRCQGSVQVQCKRNVAVCRENVWNYSKFGTGRWQGVSWQGAGCPKHFTWRGSVSYSRRFDCNSRQSVLRGVGQINGKGKWYEARCG